MLIAFLIRSEDDWREWRRALTEPVSPSLSASSGGAGGGKAIVHVADQEPGLHGLGAERSSAVDDVETLDEEETNEEAHGTSDEVEGEYVNVEH